MAKLFPTTLNPNTKSPAERRLFEAFARDLDEKWYVFHHVKWIARDDQGRPSDGETDFVVAHPDLGILVIEVKGGKIRFDATTGTYFSTSGDGKEYHIGDPFEQAVKNKYSLINLARNTSAWGKERVIFGHMVAFSDSVVQAAWLRQNAPRDIIIDAMDLADLEARLTSALKFWRGQSTAKNSAPGNRRLEILTRVLAQSATIRQPLLAEQLRSSETTIVTLTENQYKYLSFLRGQRRAAIAGCAGSGKTFLAIEKARQLSEVGYKVLLTCYNRLLADHIGVTLGYRQQFDIYNFHQLCLQFARDAGEKLDFRENAPPAFFEQELPNILLRAIDKIGARYDAVIVDEGQDFHKKWWDALPWVLNDPANGIFYIFYDDNQRLYRDRSSIPITDAPFILDENCRNTQYIFGTVRQFYDGHQELSARAPQGRPVEVISYRDGKELQNTLRQKIHTLIQEDGFKPDEIVILTALGSDASEVLGKKFGNWQLVDNPLINSGEIWATTVRKFKGMERAVVLLTEVDNHLSDDELSAILYVGTSRARLHLVVLLSETKRRIFDSNFVSSKEEIP